MQKQFMRRRVSLWSKLGNAKPGMEVTLANAGAMVGSAGFNILGAMVIQRNMLLYLLEVHQEWGVKKRGSRMTLKIPDQRL